jgi:hypothetical protein
VESTLSFIITIITKIKAIIEVTAPNKNKFENDWLKLPILLVALTKKQAPITGATVEPTPLKVFNIPTPVASSSFGMKDIIRSWNALQVNPTPTPIIAKQIARPVESVT